MADYIERKAIKYEQWAVGPLNEPLMVVRKKTIDSIPAADVAPVVRCSDCKHWEKRDFQAGNDAEHLEYGGRCPYVRGVRYESDFCSCGEKKEGDGNG